MLSEQKKRDQLGPVFYVPKWTTSVWPAAAASMSAV